MRKAEERAGVAGAQPQQWADGPQHTHRVIACRQQPAARVPGDSRSCSREPMRLRNAGEATPARGAGESRGTGEERQTAGAATPSRAVWLGKKDEEIRHDNDGSPANGEHTKHIGLESVAEGAMSRGCSRSESQSVCRKTAPSGHCKSVRCLKEERVRGRKPGALSAGAP
ncbi:hypothetical protein MAPG_05143 [Magnaporthiopsis poae ATCC 64411]|uniref:Uncharacterized protein n=1 Tax=Magnaporthiopsis poae (strain ATCC 64411 / 73-15) TaxID=644358 RepID=A0A0C4DYL7_MAGP6|nr:hypothetical protein MAPG_05143 [Magnaporthiopsis poae ATCC 64411]